MPLSKNPETRKLQLQKRYARHKLRMETDPQYRNTRRFATYTRHKERMATDPEYKRKHNLTKLLARTYKMTLTDYNLMVEVQEGKCAICRLPPPEGKRLEVEHCHKTEYIRGLCCHGCNQGLKWFKDDIRLLRLAVAYLQGCPGQSE